MKFNELQAIRERALDKLTMAGKPDAIRIQVGYATCGIAAGAAPMMKRLTEEVESRHLDNVTVTKVGCIGMCRFEPMVEILQPGKKKVTYVHVDAEKISRIIEEHVVGGKPVMEYTIGAATGEKDDEGNTAVSIEDVNFFKKQVRIALRNCGNINPEDIEEYIAMDGFFALARCLNEYSADDVVRILQESGLRGRGGGGFPTGNKWKFAMGPAPVKYVCCNADEGDPGAFMDRSVLEGDPFAVLEAMAIAGKTIGSNQGYIYVRAEYPVAIERLSIAIKQAKAYGLLGNNIMESGFDFDIELRLGAGAFVCGEETALMTSIEGNRGEPRPRPPFPAVKGLFEKPTILNNVETWANIPRIIMKGSEWFSSMGTERSKGTKVFALGGKVINTGLVEIPMGTTLREIVFDIGGGIPNGKAFKAAQTGGPSGGCIPASKLDVQIDYDNLVAIGSMMGSGGLIVMDEDNCMVDIAKFFLDFTVDESCGKCPPCRIGTHRMQEILQRIVDGEGQPGDIEKLQKLGNSIKKSALCALGQSAPNPVLSTINAFRDEYEAHVNEHRCPAGRCKGLLNFVIDADKCRKCGLCAKKCPVGAISGDRNTGFVIDTTKCIKCGACAENCHFGAVTKK